MQETTAGTYTQDSAVPEWIFVVLRCFHSFVFDWNPLGQTAATTRMNMKITDLTDAATLLKESASDQQNLPDTVTTASSKSV